MPGTRKRPDRVTRLIRIVGIQANLIQLERHPNTRGPNNEQLDAAYHLLAERSADLTKSDHKRIFQATMTYQALTGRLVDSIREIAARTASAGKDHGENAGLDRLIRVVGQIPGHGPDE